jgi:hypothetical protein
VEDYLKILKVEYLSIHLSDYTQILNFAAYFPKMKTTSNGRQPQHFKRRISFEGKIGGKLRGNLKCGSAQPSLLNNSIETTF